jgi:hypothetical protein
MLSFSSEGKMMRLEFRRLASFESHHTADSALTVEEREPQYSKVVFVPWRARFHCLAKALLLRCWTFRILKQVL